MQHRSENYGAFTCADALAEDARHPWPQRQDLGVKLRNQMDGFANLRRAFFYQGEPSYVPALEYTVDDATQTRQMGWKPQDIDDRATFFLSAGYDFVLVDFGMPRWLFNGTIPSGNGKTPLKKVEGHYQTDRRATSTRRWAEARQGVIIDHVSLDHFAWPEAVPD